MKNSNQQPQYTKVDAYFATNRNLKTNSGGKVKKVNLSANECRFGGYHPADFRVGKARVKIDVRKSVGGEKINDTEKMMRANLCPEKMTLGGEFSLRGSDLLYDNYLKAINSSKASNSPNGKTVSALVIVPGFDYTFSESIARGALLAHVYGSSKHKFVPFVFSWPSDGTLSSSAYREDRVNAMLSGFAIARSFERFIDYLRNSAKKRGRECTTSVSLLAHSMGAFALQHAVQAMKEQQILATKMFDSVILAAADVDEDALDNEDKLKPLEKLCSQVVVYSNNKDKALSKAMSLLDGSSRLGHTGVSERTTVSFSAPLTTVECSDSDFYWHKSSGYRHQYYRMSPFVIKDIRKVLYGRVVEKTNYREPLPNRTCAYRLVAS